MLRIISLLIVLCILAAALAGCRSAGFGSEQSTNVTTIPIGSTATTIPAVSTTRHNDLDTRYIEWQYDAVSYESYEQLVEESDRVFLERSKAFLFTCWHMKQAKLLSPVPIILSNSETCVLYMRST